MAALFLTAVDGLRVQPRVALAANHPLTVRRAGEGGQGRLDEPPAQPQHKVKRGLLLDVVVRQGAPVLQLLASKNQTLLVRRNALLVLDLGLDIFDRIRGFNLEGDGLAREGLHEDLHLDSKKGDERKVDGRFQDPQHNEL